MRRRPSSVFLEVLVLITFATPAISLVGYSLHKKKRTKLRYVEMSDGSSSPGEVHMPADLPPLLSHLNAFFARPLPYDTSSLLSASATVLAALALLVLENLRETRVRLFHALAQVAFGLSTYYLWQLLPCYDKDDVLSAYR